MNDFRKTIIDHIETNLEKFENLSEKEKRDFFYVILKSMSIEIDGFPVNIDKLKTYTQETNEFVEKLNEIEEFGMSDKDYENLKASLEIRSDPETHMLIAYVERLRTQAESNMNLIDEISSGILTANESQMLAEQELGHWSVRKWR